MAIIPFTDRELKRAWRDLTSIATPAGSERKNPHRLLLFYAVECGLNAVWLKRHSRSLFERADVEQTGHNLRQVLKDLKVGNGLTLPENLQLEEVRQNQRQGLEPITRAGDFSILHQAWRYGGECSTPTDAECERLLQKVLTWIQGELK